MGEHDLQEQDLQNFPTFKTQQSFIKVVDVHKQTGANCSLSCALLVHSSLDFTSTLFLRFFRNVSSKIKQKQIIGFSELFGSYQISWAYSS